MRTTQFLMAHILPRNDTKAQTAAACGLLSVCLLLSYCDAYPLLVSRLTTLTSFCSARTTLRVRSPVGMGRRNFYYACCKQRRCSHGLL